MSKYIKIIEYIAGAIFLLLMGFLIGHNTRKPVNKNPGKEYFVNGSEHFLNGIRLDLPEEISAVKWESDSTLDLLTAHLDPKRGIIYLGFSGKELGKEDHLFITEHSQILPELHDYQLDIDIDSLTIFDHGRFIGKIPYANSPLDSLFMAEDQVR